VNIIGTLVSTLDDACGNAMKLQIAGQLQLAEQSYRSILQANPTHAVANHCLGMLHLQLQRPSEGLPFLLNALNAHPEIPDYWLGYLEALFQSGQLDAAKEALALGRQHGLSGEAVEQFARRLKESVAAILPDRPPLPLRHALPAAEKRETCAVKTASCSRWSASAGLPKHSRMRAA
jgi:tetratricopeptide (TPR) repeat protein